ncbi:mitochondrial inner membrane protein-domain-containing protein [Syncephalis plumigaleata]|nr:mitochondrial inner membrane protein-domain-containing protein [Syncephalis plumigaleata]
MFARIPASRATRRVLLSSRRGVSASTANPTPPPPPPASSSTSSTPPPPKSKRRLPKFILYTTLAGAGLVYIGHTNETTRKYVTENIDNGDRIIDVVDDTAEKAKLVGRHMKMGVDTLKNKLYTKETFNETDAVKPAITAANGSTTAPVTTAIKSSAVPKPKMHKLSQPTSSDPTLIKLFSTVDRLMDSLDHTIITDETQAILGQIVRVLDQTDRVMCNWSSGDIGALRKALEEKDASLQESLQSLEKQQKVELEKQRDELAAHWQEERRALIARYREEILRRMQLLREDLQRRWQRDLRLSIDEERMGRLANLDQLAESLKQVETIAKDNATIIDQCALNNRLQIIAGALRRVLESDQRAGFANELDALRQLATHYPVLESVVATISEEIAYRGVDTPLELVDRFAVVKEQVRRAAMVPENGGLVSHAVSTAMSKLLVSKQGYVSGDDVEAVLARTEYLLSKNDLDNAAREINQLKGWPKTLARDWIKAARQRLEILQALEVVETQAYLAALQLS